MPNVLICLVWATSWLLGPQTLPEGGGGGEWGREREGRGGGWMGGEREKKRGMDRERGEGRPWIGIGERGKREGHA